MFKFDFKRFVVWFVIGLTLGYGFSAFAQEAPEWAKGGTVKFVDRNGVTHEFKAEEFKIVPRKEKKASQPAPRWADNKVKKNTLTLHVGVGPDELTVKHKNNKYIVNQDYAPVGGISYSRKIHEDTNVGASFFSNKTVTLDAGVDF